MSSLNEPKKRLKAAESRRALLDAGLKLLRDRGVAPGLDRVTLKDAIELSGVPRSTAYRLYEGGEGQLEAFRADLLGDIDKGSDIGPTMETLEVVLQERAAAAEAGDAIEMARALRELIRTGVHAAVEATVGSVEWQVYMSSLASLGYGEEVDTEIGDMFRFVSDDLGDRWTPIFTSIMHAFGIRPRPPMTVRELAALATATVDGVALRLHLDPRLAAVKRPTGIDGALESWNAAAIAVESIVLVWAEPDPNAKVSADLSSWTAF